MRANEQEEAIRVTPAADVPATLDLCVREHRGWVRAAAARRALPGLDVDDLVSEGLMGLVTAWQRFDPDRGVRFRTYAHFWVHGLIRRYVELNQGLGMRGGGRAARRLGASLAIERGRRVCLGLPTDPGSMAEALDVTPQQLSACQELRSLRARPLHLPSGPSGRNALEERVCDAPQRLGGGPEETLLARERAAAITSMFEDFELEILDERLQELWTRRLRASQPTSQTALAARWGVTRQRVSQLERRLRARFEAFVRRTAQGEWELHELV